MSLKYHKIVLVGDGGTGKTSYVSQISSGSFSESYSATLGYEVTKATVQSSKGKINLMLWDTAGQEKTGPLRDLYYENSDAAIIFCDVTSRITYKNIPNWHRDLCRVCGDDLPILLFANKIDVPERKVKTKMITYHQKHPNIKMFEGSVKNDINLKESLEDLLQRVCGASDLRIDSTDTLIQAMMSSKITEEEQSHSEGDSDSQMS